MAQHLREGSMVSVTYESSPGTFGGTLSGATVTNLTEAYIEVEASSTPYVLPWGRVAYVIVTTD